METPEQKYFKNRPTKLNHLTRIALVFILLWQEMVRRARKKCLYQARCKPLLRKDIVHRYPSCSDPVQLRIQDSHANARLSLC
jgi:hypothetical protein